MDWRNVAQDKQVAVSCEHDNDLQVHSTWGVSPLASEEWLSQEGAKTYITI